MMHKITVNGQEDAEALMNFYGLKETMFEAGEAVTFSVHTATDTSYNVASSAVCISCENYVSGGLSTYSFIMPDKDVAIDIVSSGSMANPYVNNMPAPGMMGTSMMGTMGMMGMMGMNSPVKADSAPSPQSFQWEGKPELCPACGALAKGSDKFCRECGAPLLSQELNHPVNGAIDYCLYDPSGNITALVFGRYDESCRKAIADKIMACEPSCEQVGFVYYEAQHPSFVTLEMTGGEFCGNATMCAAIAAFTAMKDGPKECDLTAKCSGEEAQLRVHIAALGGGNQFRAKLFLNGTKPVSGIEHKVIICDQEPDRRSAEESIRSMGTDTARGMMFLNGSRLTPLVYVPNADTIFWENSCASGCIAVASYLYGQRGDAFEEDILMPGGSIRIACDGSQITLEETIERGETKTIRIENE